VSFEELFEDAPCGYVITAHDGRIERVNRTFEALTGHHRAGLVGIRRFAELLTPGGQIYHETHFSPLLQMQGTVRAIAVEMVRADGTRLAALVNAALGEDSVRIAIFDATDRRAYERELLEARRREEEIAGELQRSLLSGELPQADGIDIGVVYRPGVRGLEVGGDWYDVFWLEEGGALAFVVGDVVGRGIQAAATMGQLRSAVRALATQQSAPGEVLGALDGYARRHDLGLMATVVYAELDLETDQLCFGCAGHLPPLLMRADAAPELQWEGRSLPLAVGGELGRRPQGPATLAPGSTLVLFTDGLIERRGRSLDAGLEALARLAGEHRELGATELASVLVDGLRDADDLDDVCVLVVRR
jgi:sigma-B regulation protein RsbU (phosphoserine phosphatase)